MNKAELLSGSTIGILGGGQLGQMLSMAASRLGFKTHIFEPVPILPHQMYHLGLHRPNMMIMAHLRNLLQALTW